MENLVNLAKKGYEAYTDSQSNLNKTGGQELNSPHHSGQTGPTRPQIDHDEVIKTAEEQGSGSGSLFKTALDFLGSNEKDHEAPLNEEDVTRAHQKAYKEDNPSALDASSLGSAAALQILKKFTSSEGSAGKSSPNQLISLAMAEATKLFDKSGAAKGDKQDAVNGAAMTVMKLLVQSKFSPAIGGGKGSLFGLKF